ACLPGECGEGGVGPRRRVRVAGPRWPGHEQIVRRRTARVVVEDRRGRVDQQRADRPVDGNVPTRRVVPLDAQTSLVVLHVVAVARRGSWSKLAGAASINSGLIGQSMGTFRRAGSSHSTRRRRWSYCTLSPSLMVKVT